MRTRANDLPSYLWNHLYLQELDSHPLSLWLRISVRTYSSELWSHHDSKRSDHLFWDWAGISLVSTVFEFQNTLDEILIFNSEELSFLFRTCGRTWGIELGQYEEYLKVVLTDDCFNNVLCDDLNRVLALILDIEEDRSSVMTVSICWLLVIVRVLLIWGHY